MDEFDREALVGKGHAKYFEDFQVSEFLHCFTEEDHRIDSMDPHLLKWERELLYCYSLQFLFLIAIVPQKIRLFIDGVDLLRNRLQKVLFIKSELANTVHRLNLDRQFREILASARNILQIE